MFLKSILIIFLIIIIGLFKIAFENSKSQMETNNSLIDGKSSLNTISNEFYANSGCCSHHGGVAGCDSVSGHVKCRDGSLSPSCLCKDK